MDPARSRKSQIVMVRLVCAATLGLLALAIWAHFPYLEVEHRRLQPWKIVGLWIGDFVGLVWFARFAFLHAVLGREMASVSFDEARRGFKQVVFTIGIAVALDLSFTLYLMIHEKDGYEHGRITDAQLVSVNERKREKATWYELECVFTNQSAMRQQAHLRVQARHHDLPPQLSPATVQALRAGHGNIRIRYDPKFGARAWIDSLGWEDEDGIYWFSILVLFFQIIVTGLFLIFLRAVSIRGYLPWWWDIYKVLPLAVEAFWMLVMGLIDRIMDSL